MENIQKVETVCNSTRLFLQLCIERARISTAVVLYVIKVRGKSHAGMFVGVIRKKKSQA